MPEGGVLGITAGISGPERGGLQAAANIRVADTGTGISPENMEKLFQPLFTTKPKGIGLGLVVCKNLVEANGGDIAVESRPDEGTVFTMTLPVHEEINEK
jgi:signal transduction histidine kinase